MSLLIVSPAYYHTQADQDEWSGRMQATARRLGLNLLVFGLGRQIDCHNTNAQSFDLIEVLEGRTEDHVLICDCVDVAFLAPEDEIVEKFKSFNAGMVVSGEKDALCGMPKTGTKMHEINAPGYFTNLNIGLWMGERKYATHCLGESMRLYRHNPEDPTYVPDSPQAWMALMMAWGGGPEFTLDKNCVLFQSMGLWGAGDVVSDGKRVHNLVTDTWPIALHYNGDKSYGAYRAKVAELLA